ncbi:MAG TPA: class I SAM-dependent methyltransferase family protein [Mycobacteriales bacterium]
MSEWVRWHEAYGDPGSALSRRLRIVQGHLADWLDGRPEAELTVVSACAGQGRDVIEVLGGRDDADRVHATLLETDPANVAAARAAGLSTVDVRRADAGNLASYRDITPADLVLMAGVFGNIGDDDVRRTVAALPHLCRPGGTVIWTRSRRDPDLTGSIRAWFAEAGFAEQAFDAPEDTLFSVGVHRLTGTPRTPPPTGRLFTFR